MTIYIIDSLTKIQSKYITNRDYYYIQTRNLIVIMLKKIKIDIYRLPHRMRTLSYFIKYKKLINKRMKQQKHMHYEFVKIK